MGFVDLFPTIVLLHRDRDDGRCGQDDGSKDGSNYLLGVLNTQMDVSIIVAHDDKCLKLGPLASVDLCWYNFNAPRKKFNDLRFFDRQGGRRDKFPAET